MHTVLRALGACLALSGCESQLESAAPEGEWQALFNGRDLQGWVPKFSGRPLGENYANTFRVKDGVLVVSYDNYDTFDNRYGHLFYQTQPFSHYWIRAEYRFVGKQVADAPGWGWRNNGLMLHSQPPETMALDQHWPVSIEVRLLGGAWIGGQRQTATLCAVQASVLLNGERTPERCMDSEAGTHRGDQWVLVEAEVRGGEVIRHYVNGKQVMEYSDPKMNQPQHWDLDGELDSGYIAIQAESHPTEFRRIEILPLAG